MREDGYYWIKIKSEKDLVVGNFNAGLWTVCGSEEIFCEKRDIEEIGEKIIAPTHKHKFEPVINHLMRCECGAMLVKEGMFSEEQIEKIKEWRNTPSKIIKMDEEIK